MSKLTHESIRAAGGIIHKDGNIFFTNLAQANAALTGWQGPAVEFDGSLNELGWKMFKFLCESGTTVSPRAFNNMKPLLKEIIEQWLKDHPAGSPTRDQIREVFLAHGFTIKEGQTDLKPYVYEAAQALLDLRGAASAQEPNPWQAAIDKELVVAGLGVAGEATPKGAEIALKELIAWHVAVATDPAVNGGLSLQPALEGLAAPARAVWDAFIEAVRVRVGVKEVVNILGSVEKLEPMFMAAALAAAPKAPAAPVIPWRDCAVCNPTWTDDDSVRVIAITANDDFAGVQFHDVRASDFYGDGTEVTNVCTHWIYRDEIWPRATAAPAAPVAVFADWEMEGRDPVEMLDKIYAVYQRSMGKPAPDAEMAKVVSQTKDMLLAWWGEHRETIRAAMVKGT